MVRVVRRSVLLEGVQDTVAAAVDDYAAAVLQAVTPHVAAEAAEDGAGARPEPGEAEDAGAEVEEGHDVEAEVAVALLVLEWYECNERILLEKYGICPEGACVRLFYYLSWLEAVDYFEFCQPSVFFASAR